MADELHTLERRYGRIDDPALDRIRLTEMRNRTRRDRIDEQLEELWSERRRIDAEYGRIQLMRRALVTDLADAVRRRHGEGWSPTPVVGYRMWAIRGDEVVGATGHVWATAVMEAACENARPDDELPHTDRSCSPVGYGCGIYAAKSPVALEQARVERWIVGVVLLTGKVVEHEHGYRAACARVAAAVAHGWGRVLATSDADQIDRLFAAPETTVTAAGNSQGSPPTRKDLVTMIEQEERSIEWISDLDSA